MFGNIKNTINLALVCIFYFPAFSYNLSPILDNENLSNNSITYFCQDEKGMMLIGSCEGLNFYNGREVSPYQAAEEKDFLSGNIVDKIIYAGNNIFWVQTYYGLNRFDASKNSIIHFNEFQKLFFMAADKEGDLFIIKENNSIYYYRQSSNSFQKVLVTGIKFSEINNIFIDSSNTIWIFTHKGYKVTYKIQKNNEQDEILITPSKNDFLFEHKVLNYLFEDDILYIIDLNYDFYTYNILTHEMNLIINLKTEIQSKGKISSIVRYHDNYFVAFITNGLLKIEKTGNEGYRKNEIEINSGIFCLKRDRFQDIVWIGTDGKGAYTYSETNFSFKSNLLNNIKDKIERPVRALFLDRENTLWIGSKGNGILKVLDYNFNRSLSNSITEPLNTQNKKINDDVIYAFGKSKKDILWIGGENGLNYYSYRSKKIKQIEIDIEGVANRYLHDYEGYQYKIQPESNARRFRYIHDIYETSDSKLWIASVGLGIIRADIQGSEDNIKLTNIRHYTINNGDFESNYFFSIYAKNDSSIWFANRGYGVFHYNTQTDDLDPIGYFKEFSNQTINDVFSLRIDNNENFLFATGFGLIKQNMTRNTTQLFNSFNGFPNNSIHAIQHCDENIFWLSTNKGLIHFNANNNIFRVYDKFDGLQVTEFSDGASFNDEKTGTLFFGGINGFVAIQKDREFEQNFMPEIFFNKLSIFGKPQNINNFIIKDKDKNKNNLNLKFKQNFFSVSFTAIDYVNGGNYLYYYKVDELSENWINNGQSNTASFTNIAPGTYTLRVKYFNRILNKESDIYTLNIKIHPPWYLSTWAYLLYWILSLTIIYALIQAWLSRQKRRKKELLAEIEVKHEKNVFESKLQFFTNISHEFCTPLMLISGICERILRQDNLTKQSENYAKLIQSNADRLNDLILELIEFRRIETGNRDLHIEQLSVNELFQHTLEMFSEMQESKEIKLYSNLHEDIQWNSDKGFLTTIIINLVSNAFKYTAKGKSIKIGTSIDKDCLVLSVANEGGPIEESNLSRLFDKYVILDRFENKESKDISPQNGLGLAILSNMVKLLNGTIDVNNTPDGFVLFSITLPRIELSENISDTKTNMNIYTPKIKQFKITQLPTFEFNPAKPTMLVIDDEIDFLWLIKELFYDKFNIKAINDPLLTMDFLNELHPNIILCDIIMPNLSGIELTKKIKSQKEIAHIPIIIITSNYNLESRIEAMEAGAEICINKPFDIKYLKAAVTQIIERKEQLKDYFESPISSYDLTEGKLTHREHAKLLQSILKIINENISNEALSINFIAGKLNIGVRSLYRKMEELGTKSLTELIKDCRLSYASNLLIKSKMTIEEIAFKSGFTNKVTFFKTFKNKYGCTPKEYRIKHEQSVKT